jgi:hypothetical protein
MRLTASLRFMRRLAIRRLAVSAANPSQFAIYLLTYFATFSPQGISFHSCLNAASVVFSSVSYFAGGR